MSPLNLVLIAIIVYLVYKIVKSNFESEVTVAPSPPRLPKLRKDMTVAEIKNYDGTQPDGRVLLAVNGIIFDVTPGKRFYGPGKCFFFIKFIVRRLYYKRHKVVGPTIDIVFVIIHFVLIGYYCSYNAIGTSV